MAVTTENANGILYALLGGPILLAWGFRKLKQKRLIENTPSSKVRSAAMGHVELSGMARQRKPQKSPVSGMDACWWNCQLQELKSKGKHSKWVTFKQVGSLDLFYLEDATGRVLVNPLGAELHILNNIHDLNALTRTKLAPVLNSWGVDDMNWFGGARRLRIIEQLIPECAPLYVMGELVSIGGHLEDRQERLTSRLRAVKANPAKMKEADSNQDGSIDPEEWDAFRAKQEEEFLKEEMARHAQMPNQDMMLIKSPLDGPFVVSTQDEQMLLRSFAWLAPLGIFGGIAVSGVGVWWALSLNWSPLLIVGTLSAGFVLSLFGKSLNFGAWRLHS